MTVSEKSGLRTRALAGRRALEPAERTARSREIAGRLYAHPLWRPARSIHLFIGALEGEVETREIAAAALAAGKRVYCPRVRWTPRGLDTFEIASLEDLERNRRGLWEPSPARARRAEPDERPDLILVPGLAFDREGGRIGYGAGLYDRFLVSTDVPRVALAFSLQVIDRVPAEDHDVPVDWIVTEGGTIDCRAPRGRESS
ncbi:MAG TPA: 5-formyltetrahydrofolate cyclo-ligase [Gemmatimonadota bacterium]|nr:5-formyltetrahydrofolate cyclo-ligase [Gemmatimonadota bacterium]